MSTKREPNEDRMLEALELFYYSHRFRNSIFIISLDDASGLRQLQLDIKILSTSHIEVVLVMPDNGTLAADLEVWNQRGDRFAHFPVEWRERMPKVLKKRIQEVIRSGGVPVCGLKQSWIDQDSTILDRHSFLIGDTLDARKVFLMSKNGSLIVEGASLSHPTPEEIEEIIASKASVSIARPRLQAIVDQVYDLDIDTILLEIKSGMLFEEIFTHRGAGTLITERYPNEVRTARATDVLDLLMLLNPHISSGAILPVSEEEIAARIASYYVYSVNNVIVASAMLKEYEDVAEIARVTTLPRYQNRGRSKKLLEALIELARNQGKSSVFSVSIEPVMWQFLEGLGFGEVDRTTLPVEWLKGYDLARPSRAYQMNFS